MVTTKNEKSFSRVIRTNLALLKCSGTLPPKDKTLLKMTIGYFLIFVSISVLAMQTAVYVYEFVIHAGYIETAIESFALIIPIFGGLVREIIWYLSRGKVQRMLDNLDDLWKILNAQERDCVTLYIKGTKNLTYLFLSQCIFTIFFYAMTPLFSNSTATGDNSTRILPYAFVAEVHQSPYYEMVYLFQVTSMLIIGFTCVGVDMIGPLLITTVCGHLKVIQEQLQTIDCQVNIQSSKITDEILVTHISENDTQALNQRSEIPTHRPLELVSSKLQYSVNYHKTILTICTDIQQLTSVVFLTQLIGSTYFLSAVGFKLTGNAPDKHKYLTQMIIGLVQLLICNWPPDILLTESQAVADAAYFTPWYQWPSELQKSVCIVIQRAQKPFQLTAGNFINLSLETFASMVSSAISFFMVLGSLN